MKREFRIVKNEFHDSYRIEELWEGGAVKTPFKTEKEARQRELDIAHVRGWQIKQVK